MTLIRELPESIEALCRDLSAGVLRRDPGAPRIPGVAVSTLRREKAALEARRRADAIERRRSWQQLGAAMAEYAHQSARLPDVGGGFSARKAELMGRQVRTHASDPKPRLTLACEPARVHLRGFMEVDRG